MSIDGNYKPQLVPKLLLQAYVRELHNTMVIPLEEGGIKEARDADNNIIIRDSTLLLILPPQLKKMSTWYKVMCVCECFISAKSIHSQLLSCRDCYLGNINNLGQNAQNRRSGEKANRLF